MKAKITIEVFYIKFLLGFYEIPRNYHKFLCKVSFGFFMKIQGIITNFYIKFLSVFYENPRNYYKFLCEVSFGYFSFQRKVTHILL